MKNLKRIGAIILALAMVFALSVTTFAEEAEAEAIPVSGIASTGKTSIIIKKEITAFNPDGSQVNAPSITYTYTIAPGSADKTITDEKDVSVDTVAGPAGAKITTPSITWDAATAADRMATALGGHSNTKEITVDLSDVTFPAAGVYRYVITESATYTNTGVVDGGDHTRYLDVYIKNSATAGQYEIYGYVLFTNNNDIDGSKDAAEGSTVNDAAKTQGFIGDNADKYYTYNLTVEKVLNGDTGMNTHQFPFGLTFTGSETGVLPIISGIEGTTHPTWENKGEMSSFNITVDGGTLKIATGKTVKITGIPVGTSVVINEKNDVTGTTYSSSSKGADTDAAAKFIATNDVSNNAIINAQTAGSAEDKAVVFTNSLELISPTGIVMRFAPYVLILGAGIVLLIVALKRKSRKHDDD